MRRALLGASLDDCLPTLLMHTLSPNPAYAHPDCLLPGSQMGADVNKPDGQFRLPPSVRSILSFLRNLPTRKVPGLGRVCEKICEQVLGASTCGQVCAVLLQFQSALVITPSIHSQYAKWHAHARLSSSHAPPHASEPPPPHPPLRLLRLTPAPSLHSCSIALLRHTASSLAFVRRRSSKHRLGGATRRGAPPPPLLKRASPSATPSRQATTRTCYVRCSGPCVRACPRAWKPGGSRVPSSLSASRTRDSR